MGLVVSSNSQAVLEAQEKNKKKPEGMVDVILLAYLYILESANLTAHTASIHAKQLESNALSQQRLNNKAAAYQWDQVPNADITQKWVKYDIHEIGRWHLVGKWMFETWHVTYKKRLEKDFKNKTAVDQAEELNEQVAAQRQVLSDRLTVMQQDAQVKETQVNSTADESMQALQEGINIMVILKSLTYSALLRRPVQS